MTGNNYRPDIDGLRALAILSVLFFHVGFNNFTGGFLGVDIFFVISGFLITRLIKQETLLGVFSFSNFYIRRAKRLFPAFFFTLICSFVLAIFFFTPNHLTSFATSFIFSIFNISNIYFAKQSGYFDNDVIFKPLLHTWSLSIEEQFYLIWPILIVYLVTRKNKLIAPIFIIITGIISLLLKFMFAHQLMNFTWVRNIFPDPTAIIFFLLPFRIFEFALGAIVVWLIDLQPRRKNTLDFLLLIALILIIYPILTYTPSSVPSTLKIFVPCLGTALAIYSGSAKRCGKILNNRVLIKIGLISYSLYLIHWPILVFYQYYAAVEQLNILEKISIVCISLFCANLMHHFIELKFRKKNQVDTSYPFIVFSCLLIVISFFPVTYVLLNNGWPGRINELVTDAQVASMIKSEAYLKKSNICYAEEINSSKNCKKDAKKQILILGDSHEAAWSAAFQKYYGNRPDINLIRFKYLGCGISFEKGKFINTFDVYNDKCDKKAALLNDKNFIKSLDSVILASYRPYGYAINIFRFKIIKEIKKINKKVNISVLGTYINTKFPCRDLVNRKLDLTACKNIKYVDYIGKEKNIKTEPFYNEIAKIPHFYVDLFHVLCKDSLKNCPVIDNKLPMMLDKNHLTVEFTNKILFEISLNNQDIVKKLGL